MCMYIYIYISSHQPAKVIHIYMCVISLSHSVSHHFSIHKSKENVNPLSPPSKISRLIMLLSIPLGYYQVTYDFFLKHGSQVCSSYIPKFHYPSQKRHWEKNGSWNLFATFQVIPSPTEGEARSPPRPPRHVEIHELVLQRPNESHQDTQQCGSHRRGQKHEEDAP